MYLSVQHGKPYLVICMLRVYDVINLTWVYVKIVWIPRDKCDWRQIKSIRAMRNLPQCGNVWAPHLHIAGINLLTSSGDQSNLPINAMRNLPQCGNVWVPHLHSARIKLLASSGDESLCPIRAMRQCVSVLGACLFQGCRIWLFGNQKAQIWLQKENFGFVCMCSFTL